MIQELWMPISIISGLGLLFGLGLAYASKKFEIKADERIGRVREALPGANCAACGHTGCDAFAEAVVEGNAHVNGCPVGGAAVAQKIGEILGIKATAVEAKTARVMCRGSHSVSRVKFDYSGIKDCTAAANLYGGPSSCSYGCVGMGSCAKACPFGAIEVEDGVARVIEYKCTSCGKCIAACPKRIIELVPLSLEYTVACSSLDRGNIVRANCNVGCIGCGKCSKVCPNGAIKVNGTLAKIDPALCGNCGECIKVCPTSAINFYICEHTPVK